MLLIKRWPSELAPPTPRQARTRRGARRSAIPSSMPQSGGRGRAKIVNTRYALAAMIVSLPSCRHGGGVCGTRM